MISLAFDVQADLICTVPVVGDRLLSIGSQHLRRGRLRRRIGRPFAVRRIVHVDVASVRQRHRTGILKDDLPFAIHFAEDR